MKSHNLTGLVLSALCLFAAPAVAQPQFVRSWTGPGGFSEPWGAALDKSGNVYVADLYHDRIVKFDGDGRFLTQWGSEGTAEGLFNGPFDVGVNSSGNVFVLDHDNYRVQRFDSAGHFILAWGSHGSDATHFNNPLSLAVDPAGSVYVAEGSIKKFDGNGNSTGYWHVNGSARGIEVDPSGNLYVTDSNGRIQRLDAEGRHVTDWPSGGAFAIAADDRGNVYAAQTSGGMGPPAHVAMFTNTGTLVVRWGEGFLGDPRGIVVDRTGTNVYVTDIAANQIVQFRMQVPVSPMTWSAVKGKYRK